MRIVITGGSGLIGQALTGDLLQGGHDVIWLSRSPKTGAKREPSEAETPDARRLKRVEWLTAGARTEERLAALGPIDAVVNLAGTSINSGRWTKAKKREILESRLIATETLIRLLQALTTPPRVLVSASAVEARLPVPPDADLAQARGLTFLAYVTRRWEKAARQAEDLGVRTVIARFGVVFAREGGALPRLILPYRLFVGGQIAGGEQWLSWVHIADVVGLLRRAIADETVRGPLHITAPHPATMNDVGRAIARRLNRPHFLPVPAFALRLALGEMSALITDGHRVLPEEAQAMGYAFRYPTIEQALDDLLAPSNSASSRGR